MSNHRRINELQKEDLRLIIDRNSRELTELRLFAKHNEEVLESQVLSLQRELEKQNVLITNMTIEKQRDQSVNRIQCRRTSNNEEDDNTNNRTNEIVANKRFDGDIPPLKLEEKCRILLEVEKSSQILTMDELRTATRDVCIMDRWLI